jgi:hypothetical protein
MTTTSKTRDTRSLLADDSGATMVMGVFMAMMVVGMIYYVWGLGGTIIHRERMQDAADAAAFGASVFNARGMNIIAMLNVLMAVFAVIGTACRLLYTFIEVTAIADDAACAACLASVVCIPASATFCEPAVEHDIEWAESSWLNDVADVCDRVAQGIHYVQYGVRVGAMVGAEGYVLTMLPARYRPTVTTGVFVPGSLRPWIQSEDDTTTWACHHGWTGMFVRGPALLLVAAGELVLFEPPSVGWIAGEIAVGIQEFATEEGSEYYCKENGGSGLTFQRVPVDSWLGDSHFQNYSAVYGTPPYTWATGGVAVANWGNTNGTAPSALGIPLDVITELHRFSFADSEYYFEEDEANCGSSFPDTAAECAHQEWLWHTRWRARMRRFHAGTGVAGALSSVLTRVENVIVH